MGVQMDPLSTLQLDCCFSFFFTRASMREGERESLPSLLSGCRIGVPLPEVRTAAGGRPG